MFSVAECGSELPGLYIDHFETSFISWTNISSNNTSKSRYVLPVLSRPQNFLFFFERQSFSFVEVFPIIQLSSVKEWVFFGAWLAEVSGSAQSSLLKKSIIDNAVSTRLIGVHKLLLLISSIKCIASINPRPHDLPSALNLERFFCSTV